MTPEGLFTTALQLEAGWKVTECRFEGEPRRLFLKLDFEVGKRLDAQSAASFVRPMTPTSSDESFELLPV